jgi:hypothetical protein
MAGEAKHVINYSVIATDKVYGKEFEVYASDLPGAKQVYDNYLQEGNLDVRFVVTCRILDLDYMAKQIMYNNPRMTLFCEEHRSAGMHRILGQQMDHLFAGDAWLRIAYLIPSVHAKRLTFQWGFTEAGFKYYKEHYLKTLSSVEEIAIAARIDYQINEIHQKLGSTQSESYAFRYLGIEG